VVTGLVVQSLTQMQDLLHAQYFDRFKRDAHGKSVVNDQAKRRMKVRHFELTFPK
jgi:hypothetical protein